MGRYLETVEKGSVAVSMWLQFFYFYIIYFSLLISGTTVHDTSTASTSTSNKRYNDDNWIVYDDDDFNSDDDDEQNRRPNPMILYGCTGSAKSAMVGIWLFLSSAQLHRFMPFVVHCLEQRMMNKIIIIQIMFVY